MRWIADIFGRAHYRQIESVGPTYYAGSEQTRFLARQESAVAPSGNQRVSDKFRRVHRERESPILYCHIEQMGKGV